MDVLSQWWSTAAIMSELVSSFLLVIIVAFANLFFGRSENKTIKWVLVPFIYGYAALVAIFCGFGIGMLIKPGEETALMSLPFTIIKAIFFQKFQLVLAAVSFQTIGSILGMLFYIGASKLLNKDKYDLKDGLIIFQKSSKEYTVKEIVAQIIFIIILVFTSSTDYGFNIKGNVYFGVFITSLFVSIEFAFFTKYFYFLLSPQLIVANLLAGHYYKMTTLDSWITLLLSSTIQFAVVLGVAYPEYYLRTQ